MKDRPQKPQHRQRRGPRQVSNPGVLRKPNAPIGTTQSAIGNPPSPATHWGDAADWYDQLVGEEGSDYHRNVVLPGAIRLLGVQAGESVLDIACGQGVLCRLLARQGVPATGIDAAPDLIRMANDRNAQVAAESPRPTYRVGDARELSFLPENAFAAVACLLAIQNIHPIAPVFASVARVLKPLGRFVVVMMHPAFRNPKETHWGWDDKQKVQYRRVDKYLLPRKVPIVTHPGKGKDYTWTFHKPIEAFVKAARNAGLLIDALEEWPSHKTSTSGPRAPAENVARSEIPLFLALRAIKVQNLPTDTPGATQEGETHAHDDRPPDT
jgi:ubiquinone/menaquinone biosynthesis C-methylase UbiE